MAYIKHEPGSHAGPHGAAQSLTLEHDAMSLSSQNFFEASPMWIVRRLSLTQTTGGVSPVLYFEEEQPHGEGPRGAVVVREKLCDYCLMRMIDHCTSRQDLTQVGPVIISIIG